MARAGAREGTPDSAETAAGGKWFLLGIGVFLMIAAAATLFSARAGGELGCGEAFDSCTAPGFIVAVVFLMGLLIAVLSMAGRRGDDEDEKAPAEPVVRK